MSESTSSMAAELRALAAAYAALNRNDIDGFMAICDPQIMIVEPSDSPGAGTHRGIDLVRAHFAKHRGNWAEGSCTPTETRIVGDDRILQFAHVHVLLKGEAEFRDGDVGEVYTFRNGKMTEMRVFFERDQAMAWAGVKA